MTPEGASRGISEGTGSWIEFSGCVTPLPGSEASRARRVSILPLSFLGMALLLAPKSVAAFSDVEEEEIGRAHL